MVKMARDRFGMNEQELGDFLESLTPKINALADLLQVKLLRADNLSLLLVRSLEQLVEKARAVNREAPAAEELQPTTEHEVVHLRRTIMRLRRQTLRDPLTDTYSREFLEEALAIEWERAARKSTALGFILLRLDHPRGDQVFKLVAGKLQHQLRAGDILGRHGENAFAVIVDNTSEAGIKSLADRLWQALGALSFHRENEAVTLSLSVSAAICHPGSTEQTPASLVAAAESTLAAPRTDRPASSILVSLLSDKDAFLMEEVRRCLFSTFLLETGKVTESQVREAVRWLSGPVASLGRIARKLGWLTPRQWSRLLAAQRQSDKSVAARAVAQGYLIQDQLHWLLAIQRERPEDLADHLVDLGALSEDEAREYLQAYYQLVSRKRSPDHLPGGGNRRSLGGWEVYPLPLPPR
jgi:diguanylate cyclase (GGDEF)-like protein